jgi:molecular chaperone GrpE (heat shock protein)
MDANENEPHMPEAWISIAATMSKFVPALLAELTKSDQERQRQALRLQGDVGSLTDAVDDLNDGLEQLQTWISRATEQFARLMDHHYDEHVIMPLVRHLIPMYDAVTDGMRDWQTVDAKHDVGAGVLIAARAQVMALLACYGVEPVQEGNGSSFDPALMEVMHTNGEARIKAPWFVVRTIRCGFRRGPRMLRYQLVEATSEIPQQGVLLQTPQSPVTGKGEVT